MGNYLSDTMFATSNELSDKETPMSQEPVEQSPSVDDEEVLHRIATGTIEGGTPKGDTGSGHGGTDSVLAAIAANIGVGIVKFIAAAISGSAAMVSEGIHSIVDSGNGLLVLLGLHRSKKAPTIEHPFGFGKELYFWTLVVAVSIFALGGGASIMQGVEAVREVLAGEAGAEGSPLMAFIVLIASIVIEGASLRVALKTFNAARGDKGVFEFIKDCKDPSLYTVLLEDTAAELGLVFALVGLGLSTITGNPIFDGAASILIGLLLMSVAVVLLRECKGLLVGEGMTREELVRVRALIEAHPEVAKVGRVLTMYFGPESMLMTVDATFKPECTADQIMRAVDRIEKDVARTWPQTTRVFIEAESLANVELQRQIQGSMPEE